MGNVGQVSIPTCHPWQPGAQTHQFSNHHSQISGDMDSGAGVREDQDGVQVSCSVGSEGASTKQKKQKMLLAASQGVLFLMGSSVLITAAFYQPE